MYIYWLNDLTKEDKAIAGSKGANLAEMYSINLPVPSAFIISAAAYKDFIEQNNIDNDIYNILEDLNAENNQHLQEASKKIQSLILKSQMPDALNDEIREAYENMNIDKELFANANKTALDIIKAGRDSPFVAVRSSATLEDLPNASFAGLHATYLNIKGNNNLLNGVKHCWASLFTPRSIYYRIKNSFPHEDVLMAVIVQKMIMSNKSGVVFSANPLTNNENEIVIEAAYGLGEAIVSGSLTPDQYLLDKNPLSIKKIKVNKQDWEYQVDPNLQQTVKKTIHDTRKNEQKLSEYEIKKLGELTKKIEHHYQSPQDIEYAVESGNIYIIQSRGITTLKKHQELEFKEESIETAEKLVSGISASLGIATGKVKIIHSIEELGKIQQGDVLVARMSNPDYTIAMKRAAAIVTDVGGVTSHASIVSRELGIPCIVGTENATQILKDNQLITVDGYKGIIYEGKVGIKEEKSKYEQYGKVETITEIKTILDISENAEKIAEISDGVGSLRLGFIIAENNIHPSKYIKDGREEEYISLLTEHISKIARVFKNKPVWIRTSDLKTDESNHLEGGDLEPKESNPILGWHGIRRSLDEPDLLKAEFTAIKRLHDKGFTNVGVMIPFVINVEEIKKAKEILLEVGLEACETIDFGVMIETPAACKIIKEICEEGVDFISFGTNELTQLTLGVDKNNENTAKLFNELHPAVLREIKDVVKTCKEYNVETSVCGEAGSNPEMAEFLVKVGIDSIAANPDAVEKIRHVVARAEKRLLLKAARKDLDI